MEPDCELKRLYQLNRTLNEPWHTIFATLYSLFALSAFVCNSLLLFALHSHNKKRQRSGYSEYSPTGASRRPPRTAELTRDLLIAHLATFDLILSLTIPFTALDVLSKFWPLGSNTELMCRLTRSVPTTAVYCSSIIIILIAVNCYRQVLHSSKRQISPATLRYVTPTIIIISVAISTPIFYHTKLYQLYPNNYSVADNVEQPASIPAPNGTIERIDYYIFNDTDYPLPDYTYWSNDSLNMSYYTTPEVEENNKECEGLSEHEDTSWVFCIENWSTQGEAVETGNRLYYSMFSFSFQLIAPFIIISISYFLVYRRLKRQAMIRQRILGSEERVQRENNRATRRNKYLVTISLVFLIAWLPLSLIGLMIDFNINLFGEHNMEATIMFFMTCHLFGMSSASANPIIYGYSNKHIRKGKT